LALKEEYLNAKVNFCAWMHGQLLRGSTAANLCCWLETTPYRATIDRHWMPE